ncbi:MAG: hypothetical protein JJ931_17280, partial [Henriciella sp.]|nr:hypothetical protein [Henriciella sp.]
HYQLSRAGWGTPSTASKALFANGKTLTFKPEGTDRFGRTRAHVYLDGTHIGWLLAKDGLSAPWPNETVKPNWCE